jgi:hypothetical protein
VNCVAPGWVDTEMSGVYVWIVGIS